MHTEGVRVPVDSQSQRQNVDRTLKIRLLGSFEAHVGQRVVGGEEWRLRKARSLVKLLALAPNHRLHREELMETLWPDLDPQSASRNFRKALHVARHALEARCSLPSRPSGRPWRSIHSARRHTPTLCALTRLPGSATKRCGSSGN